MSDALARVTGAGVSLNVNGKEYQLRPVGLRQLQELQKEALRYYKRQYLQTFADAAALMGNGTSEKLLAEKIEQCARWDVCDLPEQNAYDAEQVPINEQVLSWLRERYGELPDDERRQRALLNRSLDAGEVTPEEIRKWTGKSPRQVKVPYDSWWVTSTFEGMITLVWAAVSSSGITREEVGNWPLSVITEASQAVEQLIAPDMGNT